MRPWQKKEKTALPALLVEEDTCLGCCSALAGWTAHGLCPRLCPPRPAQAGAAGVAP